MINRDSENINRSQNVNSSIEAGINYLYDHQLPNGEFLVYMAGDEEMQGWTSPESSVFPSSLIGSSLLFLHEYDKVNEILHKAADFLQNQMGFGGTWNHFTRSHKLRSICPQDVDDTACVSKFLLEMGRKIPQKKNRELILDNRRKDGLFYTWFTFRWKTNRNKRYWYLVSNELKHFFKSLVFWHRFECTRYDVDAIVNSNVLYYLGKMPETKPVISFLINIIEEEKETDSDKWYRNPFTVYYFISRNYTAGISEFEKIRSLIINRIKKNAHQEGRIGSSVLDTALAVSSLADFGSDNIEMMDKAIEYINAKQNSNGSWDRHLFYYGGPKKITGFGSEELTTAFCLESLEKYCRLQN